VNFWRSPIRAIILFVAVYTFVHNELVNPWGEVRSPYPIPPLD
jgi:hypothetical protein